MRRPCSAGPLLSLPRSVGQRDRRVATSVATSARGDTATGCVSGRVATASRPTRSERRREQVRQDGSFAKKQEGRTVILLVAARAREEPPATPASVRQRTRECPIQGSACEAGARRTRVSRLGDARRRYRRVANDLAPLSEFRPRPAPDAVASAPADSPRGGLALRGGVRIGSPRSAWMARRSGQALRGTTEMFALASSEERSRRPCSVRSNGHAESAGTW